MEFVRMKSDDPNADWVVGPYGIDEPHSELPAVDPQLLDLVLVPGVAFGPNGERIGRGAGYFDRFIPSAKNAFRAALAFDFQLVDRLDQNAWDQPVHWILSEKREIGSAALDKFLNTP
jgi:5-formyltetrahydrofolate cyclo-ligase